jgi:BirA family biotin operon repressor/biotin-[acetyl-CoA-carboxylase] ligase
MPYDGLGSSELAERLRVPQCVSLIRVTSTLDIVHELAADGAAAGMVVLADEQVAGRGRRGQVWHSPPGRGIWLGYLARPRRPIETGVLALRVGLAVAHTLEDLAVETRLKWPNDILLGERKLAGVLCETRWQGNHLRWVAVGIGMNVHGPLPAEVAKTAISLDAVRPGVRRVDVLEQLVPRLLGLPDDAELTTDEQLAYERFDWLRGKDLVKPLNGRVLGVDERGALLVKTGSGLERVAGGHVVAA